MQLTSHFSLAEFVRSGSATRLGLDNSLPEELRAAAVATCEMLERIRAHLTRLAGRDVPITITSGYRCLRLNRLLASSDTSDHVRALAADWSAPDFGTPTQICRALAPQISALGIGQLINEYPDRQGWVHTSTRTPDKVVNRIITITAGGTSAGVREV